MIKARTDDLLLLGLSAENLERLKQGQPIVLDGAQVGIAVKQVVIFYGETEAAMLAELQAAGFNLPPGSAMQ